MEIILVIALVVSLIANGVLWKYQPTVYLDVEEKQEDSSLDFIIPDWDDTAVDNYLDTLFPNVVDENLFPNVVEQVPVYAAWKNETNIQQEIPVSKATHKAPSKAAPFERPYGFTRF